MHFLTHGRSGVHIINLGKTWEKLVLAARVIAAVENPKDVCIIAARPYGHRAVLKFANYIGATAIAGRYSSLHLRSFFSFFSFFFSCIIYMIYYSFIFSPQFKFS